MTEEVELEVEAVEAMYGSDCTVFRKLPPHLGIDLKPRTADDLSVQFVEATLVIKASPQYPDVPPELELKDVRGLGDNRHTNLLRELHIQASELSGAPMLVTICEAAICSLTSMNFPEGDCCFCMSPLVEDDGQPFMKIMSCFHCFHSDCFGRWWRWLHQQQVEGPAFPPAILEDEDNDEGSLSNPGRSEARNLYRSEELVVNCPVCRMVISAKDVAHAEDFLTSARSGDQANIEDDASVPTFILTKEEMARRAQFIAEFEAQQARGAIIETKKLEVIQPGMVPPPRTPPAEAPFPGGSNANLDEISTALCSSSSETTRQGVDRHSASPRRYPHRNRGHEDLSESGASSGRRGSRASHPGNRMRPGKSRMRKEHGTSDLPHPRSHQSTHQAQGKIDEDINSQ